MMTRLQYRLLDRRLLLFILPCILMATSLMTGPVFAAEEGVGWRSTYDEIMRWVNFAIFVFVIVKFSRKPLVDFLNGRKEEVADEIEQVEKKKDEAQKAVDEINQQLQHSTNRLEEIKARIIKRGEQRKEEIIAEAKSESELMLSASKAKIKGQIANAQNHLRSEMIDQAIDLALKRLPAEITPADDARLVNDFLEQALYR